MLQNIRDKITGWFASVFLGAIAVVFVFWGIDFQSSGSSFAAEVNGEKIQVETVRRAWQNQLSQLQQFMNDIPEELLKQQQRTLMDQFVRQKLLTQRARELGYSVSDRELLDRLGEVPQFQENGKFSKDRYDQILQRVNMVKSQYESELRTELLAAQLQDAVVNTAFIAPYELERRYALEKQQREIDYVVIPSNAFNDQIQLTDAQVQEWYDSHKAQYRIPETVDLEYLELTRASVQSGVTVTEEALKDYYEQVKGRFTTSERRRGRQILLAVEDGKNDAAVKKKAEELLAKAKEPNADFAKLAKENSEDPGSAELGGEVDWQTREDSVPEFADAFFSMSVNEIRGPVKTQFGYHIIKLEQIEAGAVRPFEAVRAELEPEFRKERSDSLFYDQAQNLGEKSFAALTELASVAKELNLELRKETGFTREAGGRVLGNDPGVIEAVFSEDVLERGQNSSLLNIGEDRALVVRVASRTPASEKPLAEVRPQVEAQVRTKAARDAAAKQGNEALTKLKAGADWATVVAELKVPPAGRRWVSREDNIAPPKVVQAAFSAPVTQISEAKPHLGGVTTDDGNFAVFAVSQVKAGDPATETEQQRTARRTDTARAVGNYEFGAYVGEAEANAKIRRNDAKVFE